MPDASPQVGVRPAEPGDFEAVARLLAELGRPEVRLATHAATQAVYQRHIARDGTASLVAVLDGSVIGFLSLEFRERLNRTRPQAWIPDIIVMEAQRGRGVGKALLRRAIDLARERNCWSVVLESGRGRLVAHQLYRAMELSDEGNYFIRYFD